MSQIEIIFFSPDFTDCNFLAVENESEDSGCIDEVYFYGNQRENSSVLELPFASCQFNPLEFDANETRHKFGTKQWINARDEDAVVDCFVEHPTRLTRLTIGVCDNGATDVKLDITMESDSGRCQTAFHHRSYPASSTKFISGTELGSCEGFDLSGRIKLSFTYPSADQICIDRIVFNEVINK